MATWFRIRSADPSDSVETAANAFDRWEPDTAYLTDGTHLYRYLGAIPSGTGELLSLESCLTLKAVPLSLDDVRPLRLRGVVPGDRHEGAGAPPADQISEATPAHKAR